MHNAITRRLFLKSLNRLRKQHFGDQTLKFFEKIPETGEQMLIEMAEDWSARRTVSVADSGTESGAWQIQIAANDDWKVSQAFMNRVVVIQVGDRRFKVRKLEKPIGNSKVWKLRAEIQ